MEQLLDVLNKLGVKLSTEGDELHISAPPKALSDELMQSLRLHKKQIVDVLRSNKTGTDESLPSIQHDSSSSHEPFPLTDVQHAYWLGRDSAMEMGNVATHLYVELDCNGIDIVRLNDALCRLIERHDMLRAVVGSDGMQRILPTVPQYKIAVTDRTEASCEEADRAIDASRQALSHQVLKADRWPLFDIRATLLPSSRMRLHISLDLLILDAWSIFLFFREWSQAYEHPDVEQPKLGISFRDYVLAERNLQGSDTYRRSHDYWMSRVDTLPAAPDLPLRSDSVARKSPRFSRREARLEKARWQKLRTNARNKGLTPSGLLLALYSEVLARWSGSPHFTLNLTVSNRLPVHKDINNILGDFTTLIMQEVDRRDSKKTFIEFAQNVQKQFLNDFDHRQVSGVSVMREWAKRRGIALQAAMPVVFSSGLIWSGDDEVGDLEQFGSKVYSVSQTSQVWLDHHVMELDGDLVFIWDAADAVFEDGVLDAMFDAYCDLIKRLVDDESLWTSRNIVGLPADMLRRREEVNLTSQEVPQQRIHAGFVNNALRSPHALAVVSSERTMTYGELLGESAAVADWLIRSGVTAGEPVAVMMRKGWEQMVAVYGVLLAGAAYMPIDPDLPKKRQLDLLRIGAVRQVLSQPDTVSTEVDTGEWDVYTVRAGTSSTFGRIHAQSLEAELDELAYVIFTSGTTGVPKGVMINHLGAMNTIKHINKLYGVGQNDRALAVSSLSFDLSVYDIFGLHEAGGAIVLPDYGKGHDPIHWRNLIEQHQVTIWNSAPQLMRMLIDSFTGRDQETISSLRTVLLSGDFIPLDIPERIRQHSPKAEVISLGGATEASIWSIYYPVKAVDPAWNSIPYGKPLPNQTIWVYDQAFRVRPDYVKGRIFIGGIGLATGYWKDDEKTDARFIRHPETGERLYDTGDLGRYMPDGNVAILGRDDGQIKIRGHRIELGEIETVLRQHAGVRQAVVLPTAGSPEIRQLVAYIESDQCVASEAESHGEGLTPQSVKEYLGDRLPDYMVPLHVVLVDRIPISANGKIDYKALSEIEGYATASEPDRVLPRNEVEQTIFDAWSRVIVGQEISVTHNFFELGGDSILATQLVREINAALPFELEMHELFENLTIESLAALYLSRSAASESSMDSSSAGKLHATEAQFANTSAILADVQAAVEKLETLNFRPKNRAPIFEPAILVTGATGWVGAHLLSELLSKSYAKLYCLVRARDRAEAKKKIVENMSRYGLSISPSWMNRIEPICGDLSAPQLGLKADEWKKLSESISSIFHLGASVNVLMDYSTHRDVNVNPIVTIAQLAVEHHLKPVFACSPMTVCRRFKDGVLEVLTEELVHADPDGLMTGYAQSKWAAEQVLMAAVERGLPVKIFRTSHTLPSAHNGQSKQNDTYASILQVACEAGVIPDWAESSLHGVPVDVFCRLMVEIAFLTDNYRGVIHIENRDPFSLKSLVAVLLEGRGTKNVPLEDWKNLCIKAAERLSSESANLARMLFTNRASGGAAVGNMFSSHSVETRYVESRGLASELNNLTPVSYWRMVGSNAGW